jgi:hypothetical protein
MAHNDWIRPLGVWPLSTVLTANVMHLFDERQMQSINGDLGGVWAPTTTITLGNGLGVTVAVHVTGGFRADDADVTITGSKKLHVLASGTLLTDANSTTTFNGVVGLNNVMTVGGSTGQILVNAGRPINVHGTLNILGDGAQTIAGTATVLSGGFLNIASGGTIVFTDGGYLSGTIRTGVFSAFYVSAFSAFHLEGVGDIASGAHLDVLSGGSFRVKTGGVARVEASGTLDVQAGATFTQAGDTARSGPEVLSVNAYTTLRCTNASTSLDQEFDARLWDVVIIPTALVGGRAYSLLSAGVPDNIRITFRRRGNADTFGATIYANGGLALFQFMLNSQSKASSVTFLKLGGVWTVESHSGREGTDIQTFD